MPCCLILYTLQYLICPALYFSHGHGHVSFICETTGWCEQGTSSHPTQILFYRLGGWIKVCESQVTTFGATQQKWATQQEKKPQHTHLAGLAPGRKSSLHQRSPLRSGGSKGSGFSQAHTPFSPVGFPLAEATWQKPEKCVLQVSTPLKRWTG